MLENLTKMALVCKLIKTVLIGEGMTKDEYAVYWAAQRARMDADGWVVKKLRSKDPNWSQENPGDFLNGDWGWSFHQVEKLTEVQPAQGLQKKRLQTATASRIFASSRIPRSDIVMRRSRQRSTARLTRNARHAQRRRSIIRLGS